MFPHKTHAPLKLACTSCHAGAAKSEKAGLPSAEKCVTCHPSADTNWPKRRVFRLADFVFFSHGTHGKIECQSCHGEVTQTNALRHEGQTSMKFCVSCHRTAKATLECNACHELSQ